MEKIKNKNKKEQLKAKRSGRKEIELQMRVK
jgi:hypothetical protein